MSRLRYRKSIIVLLVLSVCLYAFPLLADAFADDSFPWEIFYPAFIKKKTVEPPVTEPVPSNQFNIGDSIGEGEAAYGEPYKDIGAAHHDIVWSTGYNTNDIVYSLNERFEDIDPASYTENSVTMDSLFNKAVSGSKMANFVSQASEVKTDAVSIGGAGMVTILLGNNDMCADSLNEMTDPGTFEAQFRAGLDILAGSSATKNGEIHVSSIPDIYWLWVAKKDSSYCQFVWWFGDVCLSLLENPDDDCNSTASRDDPDNDYPGDGPDCLRRKEFHRKIRDVYNPILRDVTEEYRAAGKLPNAYYIDIFDIVFDSSDINNGDCFHPNVAGHKVLAEEEWQRSKWSAGN
jgi:lysophospholipase L1-like esterase